MYNLVGEHIGSTRLAVSMNAFFQHLFVQIMPRQNIYQLSLQAYTAFHQSNHQNYSDDCDCLAF